MRAVLGYLEGVGSPQASLGNLNKRGHAYSNYFDTVPKWISNLESGVLGAPSQRGYFRLRMLVTPLLVEAIDVL